MNESVSAQDLFEPGNATNFFEIADLPTFVPETTAAFSRTNALWLAEFSRLIYRQERTENPQAPVLESRDAVLARPGWREAIFLNVASTQAGWVHHSQLGCTVLVFRGTEGFDDGVTDARVLMHAWSGGGKVHSGVQAALDLVWEQVAAELLRLTGPIFFTGHSLGAALATLAAARAFQDSRLPRPAALYTFGSPRVGDAEFATNLAGLHHYRIVNDRDIVTHVPPPMSAPLFPKYQHSGQPHRLLPGGRMEVSPAGIDVEDPRQGTRDFLDNFRNLVAGARAPGTTIPQSLMDHAPVNYVARLEHLAPMSPWHNRDTFRK